MHTLAERFQSHRPSLEPRSRQRIALFALPQCFSRLFVRQLGAYPSHRNRKIDRLRQIIVWAPTIQRRHNVVAPCVFAVTMIIGQFGRPPNNAHAEFSMHPAR